MERPAIPPNEALRLAALASYEILDTNPEPAFDGLTRLAAKILGVPIVLVSLVDSDRQWFKSSYGIDVLQTPRDISFCGHVVATDRPLVVADAASDHRFVDNPLVAGPPGVRFYAGYPLRTSEGLVLGTFCAIDVEGREVEPGQLEVLEILADEVMAQLELRRKSRLLAEALLDLRRSRDDLLAVLDQLRVGTIAIDPSGMVTFASKSALPSIAEALVGGEQVRWEDALGLPPANRKAMREMIGRPERERTRIGLRLGEGEDARHVEIEIVDDPRDSDARFFHLYDVSEIRTLRDELARGRRDLMVGESQPMRELYAGIEQVAAGDWTVLVEGETGVGKELVAQSIHRASKRRDGPLVAVNCAGLTESILGSQLFGHVKGAFTGASTDRLGVFEAASGGSLFLDEIGDVGLPTQGALLRALQEREITRLGETRSRKVDVRVIAATNQDLRSLVARGLFREDLLYRIRNARILVPPLRERRPDIPLLISSFLAEERVTGGKLVDDVSPEAMDVLLRFDWPGNVRELRGAIEHAVIRCLGRRIEIFDLPKDIVAPPQSEMVDPSWAPQDERGRIIQALRHAGGNRARAARTLKMGRATLYRRLAELNIGQDEIGIG